MHKIKVACLSVILCSVSLFGLGQDFFSQFKSLLKAKDTVAQANLLNNWETAKPKDPELFIAYFNFYVQKSMHEVLVLGTGKNNKALLQVNDTGTGEKVGFIDSKLSYKKLTLQKGFDYIDKGIALYPDRLDMRFGKISMLGKAEQYNEFANEIIETIDFNSKIESKWNWSDNKPLDNAQETFLNSIQDYVNTLYESGDEQLSLMREVAQTVLKYYPNNVESLSNISITYLLTNEYDKALVYLLNAEKLQPKDVVVLFNIAATFIKLKDNEKAKIYYGKIVKVGSEDDVAEAKERINQLK